MRSCQPNVPAQSTELAIPPRSVRDTQSQLALTTPTMVAGELSRFPYLGDPPALALDHASPTWGFAPTNETPAEIDAIEELGDPFHLRFRVAERFGNGHTEYCGLADGFLVHINDIHHDTPYPVNISAADILRVRIASAADGEYVSAHGDAIDFKGAGSLIIIEPPDMLPAKVAFVGHNRAVTIYTHRKRLQSLYAEREHELPDILQAFIAGSLRQTIARRLPLNAALLRCLEDMQGCDLEGRSRRLFIGSKAIEILCHAFKALSQDDEFGRVIASAQMKRGVIEAQQRLSANFVNPPSLDHLARDVGLSRSSLCAGFRQIMGQTVFDYISDLRMRQALAMLNGREASITQIAYAVGYSHPSSFSLAVQKRFGTTPSELRQRGLPALQGNAAATAAQRSK